MAVIDLRGGDRNPWAQFLPQMFQRMAIMGLENKYAMEQLKVKATYDAQKTREEREYKEGRYDYEKNAEFEKQKELKGIPQAKEPIDINLNMQQGGAKQVYQSPGGFVTSSGAPVTSKDKGRIIQAGGKLWAMQAPPKDHEWAFDAEKGFPKLLKVGDEKGPTSSVAWFLKNNPNATEDDIVNFSKKLKKSKDSGMSIPGDMKDFELTTFGKEVPELRGTQDYIKKRMAYIRLTKEQSPYVDSINRQVEVTKQREGTALRKEFNALPETKNYVEMKQKFEVMGEALKESKTTNNFVATDQALITLYNKMTDPDSVVRESEYARTSSDLALWNKVKGKMSKVIAGGAGLSQGDREALVKMGGKFMDVAQRKYKSRLNEYKGYLFNYGLNPDTYLKPYSTETGESPVIESDISKLSNDQLMEMLNAK